MAIILFGKKIVLNSWCQPFSLGAHHYFDFMGHESWVEFLATSCNFCLFVFQLPRWVIILFLSLTSGWGFLVFLFFFFCFLFCFVLFFLQNVQFPHHISRVRLIFFLSRRLVKFFAFFYFCLFVFILFSFVLFCILFCFQQFHPLDIKWYALIHILLRRSWWTLRHRQFWIPVQFSEKCNSNLKLH